MFWRPDIWASVVVLTPAPPGAEASSITLADLPDAFARHENEEGAHILVKDGAARHQLWLVKVSNTATPLAAVIPLDVAAAQRAEATLRFWRSITLGRSPSNQDSVQRTGRLVAALRALDGRQNGASYRAIANALFGAERVAADYWKTSPLRDTIIRLARTGFTMMRGRYRKLLGPRPPR